MNADNIPPTPQPNSGDVASWFQTVNSPGPAPAPAPPPRAPKTNHRMLIIATLGAVVLTLGLGGILLGNASKAGPCLTAGDYEALTGTQVDSASISPTTDFYTTQIAFGVGAKTYDDTEGQGAALVKKIAEFYMSHAASSIVLTLKGTYMSEDSLALTEQRTATTKDSLIASGVPATVIMIAEPEYLTAEEDVPQDASSILISITSNEKCT